MEVGFIGSGKISKFHLAALKNNDFLVKAIGTRKDSVNCRKFANDQGCADFYCSGGWEEVLEKELDAYCLCVDTDVSAKILLKVLEKDKPVLVEKPVAWNISDIDLICKHRNSSKVFVAYNRRFYKIVDYAKDFCIQNNFGTVNINIPDSKQGRKVFLSNGCHIVDLARYIFGEFDVLHKLVKNDYQTGEMLSLTALCSNEKWSINLNAHSLIPANFGITINSNKRVFELLPIEKYTLYEGLEIVEPDVENPIRRYIPKIIKTEWEDSNLKPGFDNMYKNFREFVTNNSNVFRKNNNIQEAKNTLLKCIDLSR